MPVTSTFFTTGVVLEVALPSIAEFQPLIRVSMVLAEMESAGPSIFTPVPAAGVAVRVTAPPRIVKVVSMVLDTFDTSMPVMAGASPLMVTLLKSTFLAL